MPVCPQSKSLAGDSSLLFSPPSIIKDTLPEEVLEEVFALPKSASGAIGITVSTQRLFFVAPSMLVLSFCVVTLVSCFLSRKSFAPQTAENG